MGGYKGTLVSIVEMLEELRRNGRTAHDAGQELRHAIEDGAIPLLPIAGDRELSLPKVASDVEKLGSAYGARLRGDRVRPSEMTWLQYLKNVQASREHFQDACELGSPRSKATEAAAKTRPRPIESGIAAAIDNLWPSGFPVGQRANTRNSQIKQYLMDHGYSVPASDEALEKAIQRHLRNRNGRK
jgi:hypothetical protein